jgi:hypothetical protein
MKSKVSQTTRPWEDPRWPLPPSSTRSRPEYWRIILETEIFRTLADSSSISLPPAGKKADRRRATTAQ